MSDPLKALIEQWRVRARYKRGQPSVYAQAAAVTWDIACDDLEAVLTSRSIVVDQPCYCCRGEWDPADGGQPQFCQSGCRCYGRCDNPNCCENDQGSLP
jgi:hypothetical protein